jgi:hypothetical protein
MAGFTGRIIAASALILSGCENISGFKGYNSLRDSKRPARMERIGETDGTAAQGTIPADITIKLSSQSPDQVNRAFDVEVTVSADHIPMRATDFVATNATIDGFGAASEGYRMSVRPASDGVVEITAPAGVVKGLSGSSNSTAATLRRMMDATAPTASMEWLPPLPGGDPQIYPVKVTVSEPHKPLTAAVFVVTNGQLQDFNPGVANTYTFNVRIPADGLTKVALPGGNVTDLAGNSLATAVEISRNIDRTPPTARMNWRPVDPPPGNAATAGVSVTVSEAHDPLSASDFLIVNGRISGFAVVNQGYQFNVETTVDGPVTVTLPAGKVRDTAGNLTVSEARIQRAVDRTPPVVTMNWSEANPPENLRTVPVVVNVSEAHVALNSGDFVVSNGAISEFVPLPGSYTFKVTTSSTSDVLVTVTLPAGKVRDHAGNMQGTALQVTRAYRRMEIASGPVAANVTVNLNYIWFVDSQANTRRILLDEAQGYPMVEWNGVGPGGGHRTFVSSVGLIIGQTGGRIYRADSDVKSSTATATNYGPIQQIFDLSLGGTSPVGRVCVTAFKDRSTGVEYVGAGYSSLRNTVKSAPLVFSAAEPRFATLPAASNMAVTQTRLYDAVSGDVVPNDRWRYLNSTSIKIDAVAFRPDAQYRVDYTLSINQHRRLFRRMPIDRTLPTKIRISAAEEFDAGPGGAAGTANDWGYSCYTDQGRNIFWSKGFSTNGNISGINVLTGQAVPVSEAPNQGVVINSPALVNFDLRGAASQSYALAGGGAGILLSASGAYTSAYETSSNLVFISYLGLRQVLVGKAECFTGEKSGCTGDDIKRFDAGAILGPLSSLNDGRLVGISRGNPSSVYLVKPLVRGDPSAGIEVKLIKSVSGDGYMYTDFTGATTYVNAKEVTVDLRSRPGYRAGDDFVRPEVMWHSEAADGDRWRGLSMSIRCYKSGDAPPAYQGIDNVASSGVWSLVSVPSCSGVYDQVQIKLDGNGDADFSRVTEVSFRARQ